MALESNYNLISLPSPATAKVSDGDLVQAVAAGNKAALRTVWDRYVASVRATLRSMLGSDHVIDDLVQEVFLSFYRSAGRIRDQAALRPYLLGVAVKLASTEIRSRTRRNRWHHLFYMSSVLGRDVWLPDVDERDAVRSLRGMLESIPDRERQAFVLRYVHDLASPEVAQAMGIPMGTAKRAISEGRRHVFLRAQTEPALVDYLRSGQESVP
jgi:RNA polymerase sigma-70 factor, ECF subfamily